MMAQGEIQSWTDQAKDKDTTKETKKEKKKKKGMQKIFINIIYSF